jgi:predicted DNA-binding mobile mystery protein A
MQLNIAILSKKNITKLSFNTMNRPLVIRQMDDSIMKKVRVPRDGWVRTFRHAIGMKLKDLARRLSLNDSTVSRLEKGESDGSISLNSLRKLADAMDCDVVYGLVPREGSYSKVIKRQARRHVDQNFDAVNHSMMLKNNN